MPQIKVSIEAANIEFLGNYKQYGYANRSALVNAAVLRFRRELERQKLIESAKLYQEIYETDSQLQELTDDAAGLCLD